MSSMQGTASTVFPHEVGAFDRSILVCVLMLACLGLVMVYSVSSVRGAETHADGFYFLKRQAVYLLIGLGVLMASMRVHAATWRQIAYPALLVALVLLVLVLIPGIGVQVGGARRWIRFPGFSVQPGEVIKIAMVLYMARSLSRKSDKMHIYSVGVLPHLIMLAIVATLLLAEPDLGTVLTLGMVCGAMMFIGGARVGHLALTALPGAVAAGLLIWHSPYRLRRVLSFLDPWSSPHSDGFQIIQSFLAFGSGGLTGRGLGDSQQKLFFLPEAHTDFILSVIGEELGLIGVGFVIILFAIIVVRGLRVALQCDDSFSALLAAGLAILIGIEAFTNAAVVMGLLPTKGLTLPLVSFGGSSLIVSLWACGILLSLSAKG